MRYNDISGKLDLKKMYDEYNAAYFDNMLPSDLPVKWFKSKTVGGLVDATVIRKNKYAPPKLETINFLKISNLSKRTEEQTRAILLHEMIHVEMFSKGIIYTSGGDKTHGWEFQERKVELERQIGISIPDTEEIGELNDEFAAQEKPHGFIIYKKGERCVMQLYNLKNFKVKLPEIVKYAQDETVSSIEGVKPRLYRYFTDYAIGTVDTNLYHTYNVKRNWKPGLGGGSVVDKPIYDDILKNAKIDFRMSKELTEEFFDAFQSKYGKSYVEVFKNPSKSELSKLKAYDCVRGLLTDDALYAWSPTGSLHFEVREKYNLPKDAVSVELYFDDSSMDINVTDNTKYSKWHHNPELDYWISTHDALRNFDIEGISYYDENIVGNWSNLDKDE